jgi:hypothetical protein
LPPSSELERARACLHIAATQAWCLRDEHSALWAQSTSNQHSASCRPGSRAASWSTCQHQQKLWPLGRFD